MAGYPGDHDDRLRFAGYRHRGDPGRGLRLHHQTPRYGPALALTLRGRWITAISNSQVQTPQRGDQAHPFFLGSHGREPDHAGAVRRLQRIAATDTSVLITGESGSGKEITARALHEYSRRKDQPFVAINCSALPENLLESELFGHVKGAFTNAWQDRTGLLARSQRRHAFS